MTSGDTVPLVVDLDDSLLRTDMLLESFWSGLSKAPLKTLGAALSNINDRPTLKSTLSELGSVPAERLPVDQDVFALIQRAKAEGREVIIASGSPQAVVARVAAALDIEGAHLGTTTGNNLTGRRKTDALIDRFGKGGFDYVGDNPKDVPVWQAARTAYAARPLASLLDAAKAKDIDLTPVGARWRMRDLVLGLRAHQWIKNVLLFLPLIAAHRTDALGVLAVVLGIICFSAAASSIYVINDLLDLDADRRHATKHARPFAAGKVPIRIGMAASGLLMLFALLLAAAISWAMFSVIAVYIVTTLAYSLKLKRMRWVDVAVLATLYSLRVLAGAVVIEVPFSGWLLGFIFPVFLGLGCVKRLTEIAKATSDERVPGRAYAKSDRSDLVNIASVAALAATVVFLYYSFSDTAAALYPNLAILRLTAVPVAAWQVRMILTGRQGTQSYDPIAFALRDGAGLVFLGLTLLGLVLASGVI